jgi:uncharacterized protein (DUF488 family)
MFLGHNCLREGLSLYTVCAFFDNISAEFMMNIQTPPVIYTVGHSTHDIDEFVTMLQSFRIALLVDIRGLPGSRKFPQFDRENLEVSLPKNGIQYVYMRDLGGRRRAKKDSKNIRWRNASFRGYADYMETKEFNDAVAELASIAQDQPTAIMCAEAVWWRCHRSMVADFLKTKGWKVFHIMAPGKSEEHPYTSPARIVDGEVIYFDENTEE